MSAAPVKISISDELAAIVAAQRAARPELDHAPAVPSVPARSRSAPGFAMPIESVGSHFRPRRPQRSPDRMKSRERRRTLGGSSAMPDNIRHYYTEGERSALAVVAGEVKRRGICDLTIANIAAVAGVCRTTVQNALAWARRLGHVMIQLRPVNGRRSLTNVVRITLSKWRRWITKGPSLARYIGFKMFAPTKIIDRKKEGAADKKSQEMCHEAPRSRPGGPAWAAT